MACSSGKFPSQLVSVTFSSNESGSEGPILGGGGGITSDGLIFGFLVDGAFADDVEGLFFGAEETADDVDAEAEDETDVEAGANTVVLEEDFVDDADGFV
jgi:hypothetical protein